MLLVGLGHPAQADDLLANWKLNEPAGSTTFADASGNGNTGTLMGTDTLTTIPGPFGAAGPTALYFNGVLGNVENTATSTSGAAVNNPTPTYIKVPYNAALSGSTVNGVLTGYNALTLSAWIYLPANWTYNGSGASPGSEMVCYSAAYQAGYPGQVYQLGDGYQAGNLRKMAFMGNGAGPTPMAAIDQSYSTNATPGKWQLVTAVYYGGNNSTAVGIYDLYENGVLTVADQGFPNGGFNSPVPLVTANPGEPLVLANGYGIKDNEWLGGLSDLGIWNTQLTGAAKRQRRRAGNDRRLWRRGLGLHNATTSSYAALSNTASRRRTTASFL